MSEFVPPVFPTPGFAVNSSQIKSMGYDLQHQVMSVCFQGGGIYDYENVPPDLYNKLLQSPSIGSAFHKLIKASTFRYSKRPDQPQPLIPVTTAAGFDDHLDIGGPGFYLYVEQDGGCDYTIGCGRVLHKLSGNGDTIQQAQQAAKTVIASYNHDQVCRAALLQVTGFEILDVESVFQAITQQTQIEHQRQQSDQQLKQVRTYLQQNRPDLLVQLDNQGG